MSATAHPGIDPARVTAWIAELGLPVTDALHFTRIGLGQSNLTYRLDDRAGHRWVLRRPPLGTRLGSAHDVLREARILTALSDTPVPTPAVIATTEDPAISDAPLVLMEYIDGPVVDRMRVAESLTPTQRHHLGTRLAATLADIHTVTPHTTGLHHRPGAEPYAARQLRRWTTQSHQARIRDNATLDQLTTRLHAAIPPQTETTLLHGDFHLRNVILTPDHTTIAAVLDWELSTLGDLGSMLAYWAAPGEAIGGDFPATALPGFPTRAEITDTYLHATGRNRDHVAFWHALGLWKLAIIGEGILWRTTNEPANAAPAGIPTTDQIDAIIALADTIARGAGI